MQAVPETQLAALNEITFAINRSLDVEEIFAVVEREARKLVPFDRLSVALVDPRSPDRMQLHAAERRGAVDLPVPETGCLAEALRHQRAAVSGAPRPLRGRRADTDGSFLPGEEVRSVLCVPLVGISGLVGALNLGSYEERAYDDDAIPIINQIAAQLALAIEKARLLAEERRRAEQLRLLNLVAKEVASSLDRDALLTRSVELVQRVFDFTHLACFLLDADNKELRVVALAGRWAQTVPVGWSLAVDKGIIGKAVRDRRPYITADTRKDPYYVPFPGVDSLSELAVPLVTRGLCLGALNAESDRVNGFSDDDVQTLSTLADQIAVGLYNANLYGEVQSFNQSLGEQVQQKTTELLRANREIARQKELLARENVNLRARLEAEAERIIGESRAIKEFLRIVDKVAPSDASVLVLGESGTGKELVAARLHRLSRRAGGPYVTIHCGALPENLLESELFGHEQGSFTGADQRKPGLVETAEAGTLFLDEIGELPLPLQAKLLRFLQNGEFYRIGGKRPLRANVRIVSATNRDLPREAEVGRFREDLLFRLNTITVQAPPLRERHGDTLLLAQHFLERYRRGRQLTLGLELQDALERYRWPGNVRELGNVIERLAILSDEGELGLDYVPDYILDAVPSAAPIDPAAPSTSVVKSLKELEKEHIRGVLRRNRGDKTKTAKQLGIALKTLYNKIERYQL